MRDSGLECGSQTFGCQINEFYGQTECNLVIGNSYQLFPVEPGSMGRMVPGKTVAIVDQHGNEVGPEVEGQIAVARPDPVMFLRYWNNEKATQAKFLGRWLLTGDEGFRDHKGNFFFKGRDDDIICTSGYRVGPGEIENSILRHPSVSLVAVMGKPDPVRTEIVKAFVVLRPGLTPSSELQIQITDLVRSNLAKHEYPREIEFVSSLPMTTTGKIIRKQLKKLEIQRASTTNSTNKQTNTRQDEDNQTKSG